MSTEPKEQYGISFVDFLFSVAIFIGLAPESYIQKSGIFSEKWIVNNTNPSSLEIIHLITFLVCFLTVVLSWFGYHRAVAKKPHKENALGMFRFIIDSTLVFIYSILLFKFSSLYVVILLLVLIFALYLIWDIILIFEDEKKLKLSKKCNKKFQKYLEFYRVEFVTLVWFGLIALLCIFFNYINYISHFLIPILALFIIIFYRINKTFSMWERFFGVK